MSRIVAAFFVLDLVICTAWMCYRFRIHRHPSLLGLTFIVAILRYGVMAIPYADDPEIPLPVPATFPLFLIATFTCYVIGVTVASVLFKFDLPSAQRRFFQQPAERYTPVALPVFAAVFVVTMVVGTYYATATEQTGIEMLIAYGGEHSILREFRQQFGASNPYVYAGTVINAVVGPMLIMVAANLWKSNARFVWGVLAFLMFGLLVVTSTASLSKAPIIMVILYILANRFLSRWNGGRIQWTVVIMPVVALLGLGTVGYALTYGVGTAVALDDTISRIFVAPLVGVHGFLYVYPTIVPFVDGLGIGLLAKLFNVQNYVSPDVTVGTIIAGPNTCFDSIWSTDMWANFGWSGVLIGSAFVGIVMVLLDRWCLSRRRTAVSVALYAFMLVSPTQLSEVSIFTMLLSGGLVGAPLLAWLLEGPMGRGAHGAKQAEQLERPGGSVREPARFRGGMSGP